MDAVDQAGVVPYREAGGRLEFCLITNRRGRWIFPKGFIDPGETVEQTALKEAWEEAGLHGRVVGPPIGTYRAPKLGSVRDVVLLLMRVEACAERWQESGFRQRVWVAAEAAERLLDHDELRRCLAEAVSRLVKPS